MNIGVVVCGADGVRLSGCRMEWNNFIFDIISSIAIVFVLFCFVFSFCKLYDNDKKYRLLLKMDVDVACLINQQNK